jgi:hypothetical protein
MRGKRGAGLEQAGVATSASLFIFDKFHPKTMFCSGRFALHLKSSSQRPSVVLTIA